MPLFRCEQCGCVENTACCNYWIRKNDGEPLICSACDNDIGEWHGLFDKKSADGYLIDQNGHLWSKAYQMPKGCRIVGEVTPNNSVTCSRAGEAEAE